MMPMLSDQQLVCRTCGEPFVFSAGEQELLRLRGLDCVPTRCPVCRRGPAPKHSIPSTKRRRPA